MAARAGFGEDQQHIAPTAGGCQNLADRGTFHPTFGRIFA